MLNLFVIHRLSNNTTSSMPPVQFINDKTYKFNFVIIIIAFNGLGDSSSGYIEIIMSCDVKTRLPPLCHSNGMDVILDGTLGLCPTNVKYWWDWSHQ